MDRVRLRRQMIIKAFTSPLALIPAVVGIGVSVLALILGQPGGILSSVGLSGLVFAAGVAVTKLVFARKGLAQAVRDNEAKREQKRHEAYLTDLARRLRRDRDDRTEEILDRLHRLNDRLRLDGLLNREDGGAMYPEICEKLEQLYWSCLKSLERTWDFWRAAMDMSTPEARQEMLQRREGLLAEVLDNTSHLEATVDQLFTQQLERVANERELSRIREELDTGLQVARRVEQRMTELERGFSASSDKAIE